MKKARHELILKLIEESDISTQEELLKKLNERGIQVTQATVSRDIKELRLVKVMSENGRHKYAVMDRIESSISTKLLKVFRESFISCDYANNIAIVKTLPGMAHAAASAIDSMNWAGVVGTIAGDDTIMIVCRAEKIAEELTERFKKIVGSKERQAF